VNERLWEYLGQLQDGELSPEDVQILAELLRSGDAGDRSLFLEMILLDVHLHEAFAEERSVAEYLSSSSSAVEQGVIFERRGWPRREWKRVGSWVIASCAVCLLVALGIVITNWRLAPQQAPQDPLPLAQSSPSVVAELKKVEGNVLVVNHDESRPAYSGQFLFPGQSIVTRGSESKALVAIDDDAKMNISGDTVVYTSLQKEENARLFIVEQGNLVVDVGRVIKRKMKVQTAIGIAVAEAETSLHILDGEGLAVIRGEVRFTHKLSGKSISIREGHYLVATEAGDVSLGRLFLGQGNNWAVFPNFGLDTRAVALNLAFSPDSEWLAAACRVSKEERSIRLGPVQSQAPPRELLGRSCVAFSLDGKTLAAGGRGHVILYGLPPDQPPRLLTDKKNLGENTISCLAFSPNSKILATGLSTGNVLLWDLTTGVVQAKFPAHNASLTSLAFSPDGTLLASGGLDSTVIVRDALLGSERLRIDCPPALAVWAVSFSPDSTTLAIATGPRDFRMRYPVGDVRLWDIAGQKMKHILCGHTRAVTSLAFSSDGLTIVTGSADTTVRFWNVTKGAEYGMLKGHEGAVGFEGLSVALSPDGKYLATGSYDRTVKVWKTTTLLNNDEPTDSLARTGPWLDAELFRPRGLTLAEPIRSNYQRPRYR
jgi:WD40 repeat protein